MNSPMLIRSRSTNVFLAKFWGPLLFAVPALGIFLDDFPTWRIAFASPFFVAALFGLSIAILEMHDGALRYKRFFKWTTVRVNEIEAAGVLWHPFIGYIRLNRFVFPWGRLYFALDKGPESNAFWPAKSALVGYINRPEVQKEIQSSVPSPKARSANLRLLVATCIGLLTSLMILYLTPRDVLGGGLLNPAANMPTLLKGVFQFVGWLHIPGVQIMGLAVMALLAIGRRNKPEAWLYAFLSGFALTMIVGWLLF